MIEGQLRQIRQSRNGRPCVSLGLATRRAPAVPVQAFAEHVRGQPPSVAHRDHRARTSGGQFFFEQGNLPTDAGLGHLQMHGRAAHASQRGDRDE